MTKISISLSDELVNYMDLQVENRSALIESLLEQWKEQKEDEQLAEACRLVDELQLGWDKECQKAAIIDLEASGLSTSIRL
jgi:antitoxin ParD1/3/4